MGMNDILIVLPHQGGGDCFGSLVLWRGGVLILIILSILSKNGISYAMNLPPCR